MAKLLIQVISAFEVEASSEKKAIKLMKSCLGEPGTKHEIDGKTITLLNSDILSIQPQMTVRLSNVSEE